MERDNVLNQAPESEFESINRYYNYRFSLVSEEFLKEYDKKNLIFRKRTEQLEAQLELCKKKHNSLKENLSRMDFLLLTISSGFFFTNFK